ncbi:uncharacterized protein LOC134710341 [Mytilus trossulus]|uniref:uncharacterized protein LOC134710341 n=1 Tax=Mytilus trossulus TaxID=6551 RepID=UPI003004B842
MDHLNQSNVNTTQITNGCIYLQYNLTVNNTNLYACENTTASNSVDDGAYDGRFLYIIVVLCFYGLSMVLLMVKYVRREEEEVSLDFYYTEYVKREQFNCARYQNKLLLEKTKKNAIVVKLLTENKINNT